MMSHCTMRTRLRKISCLSVYSVKALLKLSLMTEIGLVTLPSRRFYFAIFPVFWGLLWFAV